MRAEHGPDDIKSEYPSCIEECFYASLEGSYFKREMSRAREDKRIGLPLPYDPSHPVNTFWDIGMDDENCIWFHQTDGVRHRLIDFYYNSGEGLPHYVQVAASRLALRCLRHSVAKPPLPPASPPEPIILAPPLPPIAMAETLTTSPAREAII